jgi:hypothetical protein
MDSVREYPSVKIARNGSESALDPVMVEETVELIIKDTKLSSIVTTSDLHKEPASADGDRRRNKGQEWHRRRHGERWSGVFANKRVRSHYPVL